MAQRGPNPAPEHIIYRLINLFKPRLPFVCVNKLSIELALFLIEQIDSINLPDQTN